MENDNEGQQLTLSYQEYWGILRRRRNVVIQVFAVVFAVGVAITLITKPTYLATAELLVDPPSTSMGTISNSDDPLSQLFNGGGNDQTAATQVQALQAQPLLDQVQQTCGRAVLDVEVVKDTNVIQVFSESSSPEVAANSANTLLADYLQRVSDDDLGDVQKAHDFVERQEVLTGLELDDAESKLRDFRATHNIDEIDENRQALIGKVTAMQTQYENAVASLAGAQQQLVQAKLLYSEQSEGETAPVQVQNPYVASLQSKIADLSIQRTQDLQPGGFTPTSTVVVQLNREISALQDELKTTPPTVASVLPSVNTSRDLLAAQIDTDAANVSSMTAQVAALSKQLDTNSSQLDQYPGLEATMDKLTRERDDALRDDETFSTNLDNLTLRLQAEHVSAHVIQPAQVPITPERPNRLLNVIVSLLAGLIIGCSVALVQEYIDDRINSTEDAERLLELPSLGRVPQLSADDARLLPQMKGLDPETESYRILRTNIHFASIDNPLRTMQVTSAGPGEGKTTTAANLAFAMAMDGKKVILVDTDLRRPSLHKLLGLRQTPGVTDLLLGTATLEEAMRPHEALPEMSVIAAGITPPNPSELLNSQKFKNLIEELKAVADIIIFDSPPVLAASDAQIISSKVDGVIMVIANSETRKASARQSMKILRQARANVLGVAYNKTNIQESYYYYHYHYSTPVLAKEEEEEAARQLLSKSEEPNVAGFK
jgi:polysaccharide biosynthesis transport protein